MELEEEAAKEAHAAGLTEEVNYIRKKIQLSEGQRRAEYEELDAEKRRLTKRIRHLKKELRETGALRPSKFVDVELLKRSGKPVKELKAYTGKTPEEVEQILDLQCMDLKKKLDLLKYEIERKEERLARCLKEINEIKDETQMETIMLLNPVESQVTKLENKIHETSLHLQEMRHMEKKYTKMRQSLLDDRVFFQSTLDKYEEEIAKQAKEIQHLQSVRDEAVRLKEKTKRKLNKLEALVVAQGLEREKELQDLKKKVEDGRSYLEKVERSLVPPSGKGLQAQDSGELGETGISIELEAKEALQEKLHKLKEVTGAKDEEDILKKLESQRQTKDRLLKLKASIENEKKKAELKKEQLEAELEAVRFSVVKEREQNEEEMENLEEEIAKAEAEAKETSLAVECEKVQLQEVQDFIVHLIDLLRLMSGEDHQIKSARSQHWSQLIEELTTRFNQTLEHIKEAGFEEHINEPIEELFVRELEALDITSKKHEGEREGEKHTEELADVPSRDFLKRQSQIIVEVQGKRKGGYPK